MNQRDELIHGPYLQDHRAKLLEELLRTQKAVQGAKAHGYDQIELIGQDELDEIRRIWVEEKGEIEDLLPTIYESVYGQPYQGRVIEPSPLETEDLQILHDVAAELDPEAADRLYRLTRSLLAVQFQSMKTQKRSQQLDRLVEVLKANAFRSEAEALAFAVETEREAKQNKEQKSDEERADELLDVTLED